MTTIIKETLIEYWPVIVTVIGGVLSCVITYITTKLKNKTKLVELETANIELKTAIVNGSYVICPKCGEKVYLKDITIYTDGGKK